MKHFNALSLFSIACLASLLLDPGSAFAGGNGISELTDGVDSLAATFTGPMAKAIGIIALAVAAGMWAFGGDFGAIGKGATWAFVAIGIMAGAPSIIDSVFSFSGASITQGEPIATATPIGTRDNAHRTTKARN